LGGSLRTSRVAAEELKNSSHLILDVDEALDVAISWSFSSVSSGDIEFIV